MWSGKICNMMSARVTPERPPGILRSPRFAKTPEWGAGFMLPPPAPAKTPRRWPTYAATHQGGNSFAHRFNPIPHVHCIIVCSHAGTSTARFARTLRQRNVICDPSHLLLRAMLNTKKKSLNSRLENAPKCPFVLRSRCAFGSCSSTPVFGDCQARR